MQLQSITFIASLSLSSFAFAGMDMPQMGGPMKHIAVHLHDNMLEAHVDDMVGTPVLQNYGEMYMGNASVLNGTMYNAQYGWMAEGLWAPPSGSFLWIEQLSATAGLSIFSGGTMMNPGTFDPIFGTDGSSNKIMWGGSMLHNWYSVTTPGDFSATYRLYFGDANGAAISGYEAAEVTLNWTTVPTPGAAAALALAAVRGRRRRA
jgi:hypothetical protein